MAAKRKTQQEKTTSYHICVPNKSMEYWEDIVKQKGSYGKALSYLLEYKIKSEDKIYEDYIKLNSVVEELSLKLEKGEAIVKSDLVRFRNLISIA